MMNFLYTIISSNGKFQFDLMLPARLVGWKLCVLVPHKNLIVNHPSSVVGGKEHFKIIDILPLKHEKRCLFAEVMHVGHTRKYWGKFMD